MTVNHPRVVWYVGGSLPLITGGHQQFQVDEGDNVADLNARQISCMAGYRTNDGKLVLALGGNILGDPDVSFMGLRFPGIEANQQLAKNLLTYLKTHAVEHGVKEDLAGDEYCHRIEVNLCDFVLGELKTNGENWWNFVPLPIRQKCSGRQEEDDNRLKKECYLDLIDLKTIIEKNWKLFDEKVRKAGLKGSKSEALGWIDQLNSKYRRMAGHPLKRHLSGFRFTGVDIAFLRDCDRIAIELIKLGTASLGK